MHLLCIRTTTEDAGRTEMSVSVQTIRQWGFSIGILSVAVVQIGGNDHSWLKG